MRQGSLKGGVAAPRCTVCAAHGCCCCRRRCCLWAAWLFALLNTAHSIFSAHPCADNTLVDAVSCTIAPNDWDLLDWRYVLVRASLLRAEPWRVRHASSLEFTSVVQASHCRRMIAAAHRLLTAAARRLAAQVTNSYGRQIKAQYAPLPGPDPFSGGRIAAGCLAVAAGQ